MAKGVERERSMMIQKVPMKSEKVMTNETVLNMDCCYFCSKEDIYIVLTCIVVTS